MGKKFEKTPTFCILLIFFCLIINLYAYYIVQTIMKVSNLKTISQYNTLLENLNPRGKYQIRIFAICILYWMFAGMYTTIFNEGYQSFKCKEALLTFQTLGLLIFAWFSVLKGRKIAMMFVQAFSFLGLILVLLSLIDVFDLLSPTIGISIIGFSVYTQPFLLICIVCELTTIRTIQIVFSLSICSFCLGKIWVIPVINAIKGMDDPEVQMTLFLLGPTCVLSIIPSIYIYESPRYFIQKNIHKAEQLIRKIVFINTGKQGQVQIDENFILKRIHLRKYNYNTLSKYNSFGYSQYCTVIVLFFLGIISYQSKYVFQQQKSQFIQNHIQIIWISLFEIIGAAASIFFIKFCLRRLTCALLAFLTAIVSTILYAITQYSSIYENLVLLSLNSALTMTFFIFVIVNCIQFYPHSIRTLGLAMMFSSYYAGQIFFFIYLRIEQQQNYMLEMFMMACWLMLVHCFGQEQTLNKNLNYEIQEIETQEKQQFQQNEEM